LKLADIALSDGLRLRCDVVLRRLGVRLGLLAFGSNPVGYLKRAGRSRKGVDAALPGRENVEESIRGRVGRWIVLRSGEGEPVGEGVRPGEDRWDGGLFDDKILLAVREATSLVGVASVVERRVGGLSDGGEMVGIAEGAEIECGSAGGTGEVIILGRDGTTSSSSDAAKAQISAACRLPA
jgi:hypothetical protein